MLNFYLTYIMLNKESIKYEIHSLGKFMIKNYCCDIVPMSPFAVAQIQGKAISYSDDVCCVLLKHP